ncbi:helix-turn-helix domain-containing protein [Alistipes timonensis]|jgi:DNA-binding helix-turn-helix protein|uniref:helix-turn-helix domain-containing protein n=1 Tax=Alistipes timonensis TaxID=1465754 RepID=UPI001897EC9F|nr:helix-turn-helix transcriptional regulator [Alistipes timonensis]
MTSKPDILKVFGNRIRQLRLEMRLSQEELAEKAGVHRTYIGMIERAEKNITLCNIEKIASALNIRLTDLFDPGIFE